MICQDNQTITPQNSERYRVGHALFPNMYKDNPQQLKKFFQEAFKIYANKKGETYLVAIHWTIKEEGEKVYAVFRFDPGMFAKHNSKLGFAINQLHDIAKVDQLFSFEFMGQKPFTQASIRASQLRMGSTTQMNQLIAEKQHIKINQMLRGIDYQQPQTKLCGRQKQLEQIKNFLNLCKLSAFGQCLYVCGATGLGKTLTIDHALEDYYFHFYVLKINLFNVQPTKLFSFLCEKMTGRKIQNAAIELTAILNKQQSNIARTPKLLVIQNIDMLKSPTELQILYNLLQLTLIPNGNLCLICTGTQVDFFQNQSPKIQSRKGQARIIFYPYQKKELIQLANNNELFKQIDQNNIIKEAYINANKVSNLTSFYQTLTQYQKQKNKLEDEAQNYILEKVIDQQAAIQQLINEVKIINPSLIKFIPLKVPQIKFIDDLLFWGKKSFSIEEACLFFSNYRNLTTAQTIFYLTELVERNLIQNPDKRFDLRKNVLKPQFKILFEIAQQRKK